MPVECYNTRCRHHSDHSKDSNNQPFCSRERCVFAPGPDEVEIESPIEIPEGYVLMPKTPTKEMLEVIYNGKWPEDWEAGKLVQREKGLNVVPPVTELEIACGQYLRLLELGERGD